MDGATPRRGIAIGAMRRVVLTFIALGSAAAVAEPPSLKLEAMPADRAALLMRLKSIPSLRSLRIEQARGGDRCWIAELTAGEQRVGCVLGEAAEEKWKCARIASGSAAVSCSTRGGATTSLTKQAERALNAPAVARTEFAVESLPRFDGRKDALFAIHRDVSATAESGMAAILRAADGRLYWTGPADLRGVGQLGRGDAQAYVLQLSIEARGEYARSDWLVRIPSAGDAPAADVNSWLQIGEAGAAHPDGLPHSSPRGCFAPQTQLSGWQIASEVELTPRLDPGTETLELSHACTFWHGTSAPQAYVAIRQRAGRYHWKGSAWIRAH